MKSPIVSSRISLNDNLQYKWYLQAMSTLRRNKDSLDSFTKRLFSDLDAAHAMVGRDMQITVKQMNHIKSKAAEIEKGR